MTIFMRFHQSSLHCEESIALQRKKLKTSVREVTPTTPQKFQPAMKIDSAATKRPPATPHYRDLERADARPGPSSPHRERADA